MNTFSKIDNILNRQKGVSSTYSFERAMLYAEVIATIENAIVVVSDLVKGESHIFGGAFADRLGLSDYKSESSIWEKRILDRMSAAQQDRKFITELRYFNFISQQPAVKRSHFHLESMLTINDIHGCPISVVHKMYYLFNDDNLKIGAAICVYSPSVSHHEFSAVAIDTVSGRSEIINSHIDRQLLSPREIQVLTLIDTGCKSSEIADRLHISLHTVSRHRQQIIAKLRVKNSIEACRIAKAMNIL